MYSSVAWFVMEVTDFSQSIVHLWL